MEEEKEIIFYIYSLGRPHDANLRPFLLCQYLCESYIIMRLSMDEHRIWQVGIICTVTMRFRF